MPLIVDEVVISVEAGSGGTAATAEGKSATQGNEERQALIEECVERVLDILRERKEP
jgi:hypothetical protein